MEMPLTFRNSRFLIGVVYFGSLAALCMAICFLLILLAQFTSAHAGEPGKVKSVFEWVIAAIGAGYSSAFLWKLGRKMTYYEARLDANGVEFQLGTKVAPNNLFMAWSGIDAILHRSTGNVQWYGVRGTDDSLAQFTSYTFFRPRKLAKLIASRSGQSIQKA